MNDQNTDDAKKQALIEKLQDIMTRFEADVEKMKNDFLTDLKKADKVIKEKAESESRAHENPEATLEEGLKDA